MPERPGDQRIPTFTLINSELAGRMARQATASSQVDTKAALLAGLAATATQFLASRVGANPILSAAAFGAYAVAFCAAVGAYAVARFRDLDDSRPRGAGAGPTARRRRRRKPGDHGVAVVTARNWTGWLVFIALLGVGILALEWWTLGEITYGGQYAWVVVLGLGPSSFFW